MQAILLFIVEPPTVAIKEMSLFETCFVQSGEEIKQNTKIRGFLHKTKKEKVQFSIYVIVRMCFVGDEWRD